MSYDHMQSLKHYVLSVHAALSNLAQMPCQLVHIMAVSAQSAIEVICHSSLALLSGGTCHDNMDCCADQGPLQLQGVDGSDEPASKRVCQEVPQQPCS